MPGPGVQDPQAVNLANFFLQKSGPRPKLAPDG